MLLLSLVKLSPLASLLFMPTAYPLMRLLHLRAILVTRALVACVPGSIPGWRFCSSCSPTRFSLGAPIPLAFTLAVHCTFCRLRSLLPSQLAALTTLCSCLCWLVRLTLGSLLLSRYSCHFGYMSALSTYSGFDPRLVLFLLSWLASASLSWLLSTDYVGYAFTRCSTTHMSPSDVGHCSCPD